MNSTRKLISMGFVAAMSLTLVACGSSSSGGGGTKRYNLDSGSRSSAGGNLASERRRQTENREAASASSNGNFTPANGQGSGQAGSHTPSGRSARSQGNFNLGGANFGGTRSGSMSDFLYPLALLSFQSLMGGIQGLFGGKKDNENSERAEPNRESEDLRSDDADESADNSSTPTPTSSDESAPVEAVGREEDRERVYRILHIPDEDEDISDDENAELSAVSSEDSEAEVIEDTEDTEDTSETSELADENLTVTSPFDVENILATQPENVILSEKPRFYNPFNPDDIDAWLNCHLGEGLNEEVETLGAIYMQAPGSEQ